jgi:hypothetical protein
VQFWLELPCLRQYGFKESLIRLRTRTFSHNRKEPRVGFCAWRRRGRARCNASRSRVGTFCAVASASEVVLRETDRMVGVDFAWFADRVHSFSHGEHSAGFITRSGSLSGAAIGRFPVLSFPSVETQQVSPTAPTGKVESIPPFPALWRGV